MCVGTRRADISVFRSDGITGCSLALMEDQMKISLLGQFGSGNSGNDGSLEAMLIYLRKLRPDAEFLCICSNPAVIEARYNIRCMSVGGPALSAPWARRLDRLLLKLPRRLALLGIAIAQLNGFDLMIIPGTGILDDFQENAFGWPFVIFCWCLVARLCRTEIAFVSIGAGPIKGRLSRWFLVSAAKMASYRSYRDDYSLEYMRSLGVDVSRDHRYPDIAFSLPLPACGPEKPAGEGLCVGVGIMRYRGWQPSESHADAIYENYIRKISAFTNWLVAEGYRVNLFMGDVTDQRACDDIVDILANTVAKADWARVEIASGGGSLHDLMKRISTVDLAVVSRYHNLVCALKLGRPTISLGYARKNDDLMRDFGQQQFCRHIEAFDVDGLQNLFLEMLHNREAIKHQISLVNERFQSQLLEQQQILGKQLLSAPPV